MPISTFGSISLLQIRNELNPLDDNPISFADYYPAVGGVVPAGLTGRLGKIPVYTLPPDPGESLSFDHFRGVNRFQLVAYGRAYFGTFDGTLDVSFGGLVPRDSNWYVRTAFPVNITPPQWAGNPVGVSTGYTLTLPDVTAQFQLALSWEQRFPSGRYSYWRCYLRRFGYRVSRALSNETDYTVFNTYYQSDTEIYTEGRPETLYNIPMNTGSYTIYCDPQYKWRVEYYLEFKADSRTFVANTGFTGFVQTLATHIIQIN